jgi:predicted aconitase with swiveling domain
VRAQTAPAAIILGEPDLILSIGSAVAEELYARRCPIIVAPELVASIADGETIRIGADGSVSRQES